MSGNFTVIARLEVRADSTEDAEERVAEVIRAGYKGSGIAPVGVFRGYEGAPNLLDKLPDRDEAHHA